MMLAARSPARYDPANSQLFLLCMYDHNRKNWLFCQTVGGATASARLYSLIETCRANAIEPHAYLARLFIGLPRATTAEHFESLLPWNIRLDTDGKT
jgi:IS66 C-terminal element